MLRAAQKMAELGVRALPDRLKGMLTNRDNVVKILAKSRDPADTLAGKGVRRQGEVATIGADDGADAILRAMTTHKVRRLPVIDDHGPIGVVAQAAVARARPDPEVGRPLDALSSD
ncbi:CBS domain-containing protein [Kitasatospora sp. NPDC087314]|uniref:CBS domain-containing protein n=1 Tax=Kitasatospora sp. NPDC087314 TaxID=3364068 RepID=UPI00382F8346